MKISLCSTCAACPSIEVLENEVLIGEDENTVRLKMDEWKILKEKVLKGEL